MSPAAFVVVDLGFGDAGKGLLTDYLARRHGASLVVRFNGGAQAGHNVVTTDGRHHTFSQFGAGTFVRGVRTHLARPVVVHPTALRVEAERLSRLGERDVLRRLSVDPGCRVTTPFQQAAGRLRELARGGARHGSCGVGVGETVRDSIERPDQTLCFDQLRRPTEARELLLAQRESKRELVAAAAGHASSDVERELAVLNDESVADRWLELATEVARAVTLRNDEAAFDGSGAVIFEGAQGVLLDERFGFHPFATFSRCTPEASAALLDAWGFRGPVERIGVLRTHAVRHGPGPLPTEDELVVARTREPHNATGPWQGSVRKGWPDLVLLRYALAACGRIDALALTHLDALAAFDGYRWCERYEGLTELALPRSLAEQQQLTAALAGARPRYMTLGPSFASELAEQLRVPVKYAVAGPSAAAVSER